MSNQATPPQSPRRLGLFMHAITSGGAERVMTTLANAWAQRGWEIHLVTLDDGKPAPFYPLDPQIHHHPLGVTRRSATSLAVEARIGPGGGIEWLRRSKVGTLWNLLRRLRTIRQALRDLPVEAIISFIDQTNVMAILALAGTGRPLIVSERIDPAHHRIGWFFATLRALTYPFADRLVVQGPRIRDRFRGPVRRRIRIIPNPVPIPALRAEPGRPVNGRFTLAAVGRLVPQKGFDLLLQAFGTLAALHPDWDLKIYGEGPERGNLEFRVSEAGLGGRVSMPGAIQNLSQDLANAHLFVLSSRFEGFPNALCEAMALGLPCVAFDCPSGPSEILRSGLDGLLVPPGDTAGLVSALDQCMGDLDLRCRYGIRAMEVVDRFSLDRIRAQWEDCLAEVMLGD